MAVAAGEDAAYFLEAVTLEEDEDDGYEYAEVEVEENLDEEIEGDGDEDLEQALRSMKTRETGAVPSKQDVPRPAITKRPEVLDDFIRNVLLKLGMVRCIGMRGRAPGQARLPVAGQCLDAAAFQFGRSCAPMRA
jgi:hypothetical protein